MSTDPLLTVEQIKGTVMLNDLQGAGPQVDHLKPIRSVPIHQTTNYQNVLPLCSAFNHSVNIHHQHALMMNPVSAKKMVMLLQEAYPARPKVGEYN